MYSLQAKIIDQPTVLDFMGVSHFKAKPAINDNYSYGFKMFS